MKCFFPVKKRKMIVYHITKRYSIFLIIFILSLKLDAQYYINEIFLEQKPVFDTSANKRFFGSEFLNSLHIQTKPFIIDDELIFSPGDKIDIDLITETERNLRALDLFSDIKIEFDSVDHDRFDVYIIARDRWSTFPIPLFGASGGEYNYGGRIEELNFLGYGYKIKVEGLYRTENNIGLAAYFNLQKKRLFRSEYYLNYEILSSKIRTEQKFELSKPYRTLSTDYSYGLTGLISSGNDFDFYFRDKVTKYPYRDKNLKFWLSRAWMRKDRVFATLYLEYSDAERGLYRRAYDNSGKIFISFSSIAQDFYQVSKINGYQVEDLSVGGWGRAILGKIFPIGSKGEAVYYAGGQGEQSYYTGELYLFGQISAGSGFVQDYGIYTYQEFLGLGFYRVTPEILLTGRFRQQTVWNWYAHRQLILDSDTGLRGYEANSFAGDNRIVANVEFRLFPDIRVFAFALGATFFYDIGTVWNQDTKIFKTRWHNSIGFGLRFCDPNSTGKNSVYRLDFAFNFDKMKFGSIIFTSDQLFSAIANHIWRIPEIFGSELDRE